MTKQQFNQLIIDQLRDRRTVSRFDEKEIGKAVSVIINLVEAVDSLQWDQSSISGVQLNQIRVAPWIKPLLYPRKVTILTNAPFTKDLVFRPKYNESYIYDELEVSQSFRLIASTQKKSDPGFVMLDSLLVEEAQLNGIQFSIENRVFMPSEDGFIPVPIDKCMASVLKGWDNASADDVIKRYFARSFEI